MSEDSSKTESAYIQSKQANVLGRTSNPPIASFWHTVLGECMQWHKSLASSPALKGRGFRSASSGENCREAVSGGVRLVDTTKDTRLNKNWATAWLCEQCIKDPTRKERSEEEKTAIAARLHQKGVCLAASRSKATQ